MQGTFRRTARPPAPGSVEDLEIVAWGEEIKAGMEDDGTQVLSQRQKGAGRVTSGSAMTRGLP